MSGSPNSRALRAARSEVDDKEEDRLREELGLRALTVEYEVKETLNEDWKLAVQELIEGLRRLGERLGCIRVTEWKHVQRAVHQ